MSSAGPADSPSGSSGPGLSGPGLSGPGPSGRLAEPLQHLLDWFVYAPLGVLTMVREDLPAIIAAGRARADSQLTLAKFVGQIAVRQVTNELDKRLDDMERERVPEGTQPPAVSPEAIRPLAPTSLPAAVIDAVANAPELGDAASLPIDGYESLAASQVVLRLGSLTPSELAAIADYESTHRARRTILGKIHQLQAS